MLLTYENNQGQDWTVFEDLRNRATQSGYPIESGQRVRSPSESPE